MNLQTRLFGSFLLMGLIVLVVAIVGWSGNTRLSDHLNTVGNNTLPSVIGLWKINEGQTQIQSSERALLNTGLSPEKKQIELKRIKLAWKQINDGFEQYQSTPQTEEEKKIYEQFISDWETWKQDHDKFLQLYRELETIGIKNPKAVQVEILSQDKASSSELQTVSAAVNLRNQLSNLSANQESNSFEKATKSVLALLEYNQKFGELAKDAADQDVTHTNFWIFVGILIGPLTAIIFGIFFSIKIAKPLSSQIGNIVNAIVTSSAEIAATVEQQERTAAQQAAAVSQTTTTMDELGASSRVSAGQAESAAAGAEQVLNLVDRRLQTQEYLVENHSSLKQKVGQIADQILHLSEQVSQIYSISSLVSDLANQTNMLALNAAVEAVRAGDHGKGFAVVASEIRKLADQSKKSAERINALVRDIQNTTNSTVLVTDEGTKTVQNVVDAVNKIALNSQQISLTAKQQVIAIQQVVEAMNNLNKSAQETASGISQTKIGIQRLNESAQNLKVVV